MSLGHAIERVVITGSSGYLGSRLVACFRRRGAKVLGIDHREPRPVTPPPLVPDQFSRLDIRDPALAKTLVAFSPDTLIHAAFAVQPLREERVMESVNVGGARNILAAVERSRPSRLLVVSSATAYGAWPDNPVPMDEQFPRRRCEAFRYAADKHTVEELLADFAERQPSIAVSWVRPAIIGAAHADSFVTRFLLGAPVLVRFDGIDLPLQLVHEHDVVSAIEAVLSAGVRGGFNVAPPDWTTITTIARETGRPVISMPLWLGKAIQSVGWHLRSPFHEAPAGFLEFARNPWVVAPTRLTNELGFRFAFSSLDTLRTMI